MHGPLFPIDPDVDLHLPAERAELRPHPARLLGVIAAGGVVGALARYGVTVAWPHPPGTFAWSIWVINVSGSLLIGVLMVLIAEVFPGRRLVRPFFGVGVLGGYTTFSTSIVDVQQAAAHGNAGTALLYLGATLLGALLAVWAGTAATEAMVGRRKAAPRVPRSGDA
ncbi:fluoride efflux transporter FluC [Krasilnikovia sp. MM14-A1004]|uniref:fluoride efflux transporter FluC n=1 Tax=Krasilnikovia sp. MM14-A1004 TaxID=3373541 RepID=UPI00399CE3A0